MKRLTACALATFLATASVSTPNYATNTSPASVVAPVENKIFEILTLDTETDFTTLTFLNGSYKSTFEEETHLMLLYSEDYWSLKNLENTPVSGFPEGVYLKDGVVTLNPTDNTLVFHKALEGLEPARTYFYTFAYLQQNEDWDFIWHYALPLQVAMTQPHMFFTDVAVGESQSTLRIHHNAYENSSIEKIEVFVDDTFNLENETSFELATPSENNTSIATIDMVGNPTYVKAVLYTTDGQKIISDTYELFKPAQ